MVNASVSSSSDLMSSAMRLSIFSTSLLSSETMCRPLCEIIVLTGDFSIVSRFSPLRTWKLHLCLTTITATSRLAICSVRALPTFSPHHEHVLCTTASQATTLLNRSASAAAIRLCRKGSESRIAIMLCFQ